MTILAYWWNEMYNFTVYTKLHMINFPLKTNHKKIPDKLFNLRYKNELSFNSLAMRTAYPSLNGNGRSHVQK